jgi:hypothetical protein
MPHSDDRTPLAELRRNFVAALAVLGVVGSFAFAYHALMNAF